MLAHKEGLYVENWSRMSWDPGRAHVVTEDGYLLVDSGFI